MSAPRSTAEHLSCFVAGDVGNTAVKVGVFDDGTPRDDARSEDAVRAILPEPLRTMVLDNARSSWDELTAWLPPVPALWRVCSVQRHVSEQLRQWVATHRPGDEFQILTRADFAIDVDVLHPDRVGTDRLAAAHAANRGRDPRRAAIVVDSGSAITVDLVTADGVFRGGVILPGPRMAARALAKDTDVLPLVELVVESPPPIVGKSTEAAIRAGLFWGMVGAVREVVKQLSATLDRPPQLFLSGGEVRALVGRLVPEAMRHEVIHVPSLVLAGIALAGPPAAKRPSGGSSWPSSS